jgi:hypothetical protein
MSDTAERIARRRSETLEGGGGSAAWEDLASVTLGDVSASRMDAPSAPPGKSAASAFEIRFWVDIIAPCVLSALESALEAFGGRSSQSSSIARRALYYKLIRGLASTLEGAQSTLLAIAEVRRIG